ncbi:hypothetical protein H8959_001127 [Pygathrix nigripes]
MNQIGLAGASGWKIEDAPGGGHHKDHGLWVGKSWAKAGAGVERRVEGLSSQKDPKLGPAPATASGKQWKFPFWTLDGQCSLQFKGDFPTPKDSGPRAQVPGGGICRSGTSLGKGRHVRHGHLVSQSPHSRCFKRLLRGSEPGRSRSRNQRTEPTGQVHGCGHGSGMTGHHGWGYGQDDGPSHWHKLYPIAQGDRQSPINIISSQAVYSPSLQPLELSYEACMSLSITNNGHSVQVDFNDSDDRTVVTGGPLEGPYRLKQFHFHWGKKHDVGSEHTVDGKSFPSELHLVHWNAKKYSTFGEAASAPDGLAVVGVFLETGDEHPSMNRLTDALYMVRFKGTKAQFSCFNPKCLLPASRHYWTYPGSLTTPPLSESVTWIVLREPICISERQMGKFRSLLFTSEDDERIHMVNNFRPPQPLKGRVVKASFRA